MLNEYVFAALKLFEVSFNAPALIEIFICPPTKLLIVNSNVIVLSFIVPLPPLENVTFAVFPPIVTVTFDELNVVCWIPVSSDPTNLNVYVLAFSSYVPPFIALLHTGKVPSIVNL